MKRTNLRSILISLALCALLIAFGPQARAISKRHQASAGVASTEELTKRNSSAIAMILGEFRASLSDFMFIKTERYLDSGVAYAPHVDLEEMAHEHEAHEGLDEHEHEEVPTVIRMKADDFRGFLGDLERTIKPYRDPNLPHDHTSGEELLPWYRMMTLANPRQVRPYLIGAMWLSQERRLDQAIEFLQEGIAKNGENPQLFRLYVGLTTAYVKMRYLDQPDPQWAQKALQAASAGFEQGLAVRAKTVGEVPLEEFKDARWTEDMEQELRQAGMYAALMHDRAGNRAAAMEVARRTHAFAPEFVPIKRFLEP